MKARPGAGLLVATLLTGWMCLPALGNDELVGLVVTTERLSVVRTKLAERDLLAGPAIWKEPTFSVIALPTPRKDVAQRVSALRDIAGILQVGLLLNAQPNFVRLLTGSMVVQFHDRATTEGQAETWAKQWPLVLSHRISTRQPAFTFEGPLNPAGLTALEHALGRDPRVANAWRVIHVFEPMDKTRLLGTPLYHRLPASHRYGVRKRKDASFDGAIDSIVFGKDRAGVKKITEEGNFLTLEFDDATVAALGFAEAFDHPDIIHFGPLLQQEVETLVTQQLVVRFRSFQEFVLASITLKAHDLKLVRSLPMAPETYLFRFRHEQTREEIYAAAEELILKGHASYAVPNLLVRNLDSTDCEDDECLDPLQANYDYLHELKLCDAWSVLPGSGREPTLAVFDQGVTTQGPLSAQTCARLRVKTALDLKTMTSCDIDSPLWCQADCDHVWTDWQNIHGNKVALTASASWDMDDNSLRGVAPGTTLISVHRKFNDDDHMTSVAFADTLWWLAGGDPGWCRDTLNYPCTRPNPDVDDTECTTGDSESCDEAPLPDRLKPKQRATIISMAFWRRHFAEAQCADDLHCKIVCADASECGLIDDTLTWLQAPDPEDDDDADPRSIQGVRSGGVVLVAAASAQINNRLSRSHGTLTAGSVTATQGHPFDDQEGLPINEFGFIDVVAPMGGSAESTIYKSGNTTYGFGASSAATAAIAGVSALMLKANPQLTARQVKCILRDTARTRPDWWASDKITQWAPEFHQCEFQKDEITGEQNSLCFGRGLVDACAAVSAAIACGTYDLSALTILQRCDVSSSVPIVNFDLSYLSATCPCTPDGEPSGAEFPFRDISVPVEAFTEELQADVMRLIACIASGQCPCIGFPGPGCVDIPIRNSHRRTLHNVTIEVCVGSSCWTAPGNVTKWKKNAVKKIAFPLDAELVDAWQKTGVTPHLRWLENGTYLEPPKHQKTHQSSR